MDKILLICLFILAMVAVVVGIIVLFRNSDEAAIFGGVCLAMGILFGVYAFYEYRVLDTIETAEQLIASGASVYVDGQQADPEKLILGDYKVTIKDDCILLSPKSGR